MMVGARSNSARSTIEGKAPSARTQVSGRFKNPMILEFVGNSIKNIIADVFFICQNLMDRGPRPRTVEVAQYSLLVKQRCDVALRLAFLDKHQIDAANIFNLFCWSGREHDAIGLQALSVTAPQLSFGVPAFIAQETTQSISSWAALPKSLLDESALSGKNFD